MSGAKKAAAHAKHKKQKISNAQTGEQQFEVLRLNRWADVLLGILGIPPGSKLKPKRSPMSDFWISDQERSSIAWYLRRLAQTPKALKMLAMPKARRGRGRPVASTVAARNYNVALDYELTLERLTIERPGKRVKKLAQGEVGDAWALRPKTVMETYSACCKLNHWKWWKGIERKTVEQQYPGMSRQHQLLQISKTLRCQ